MKIHINFDIQSTGVNTAPTVTNATFSVSSSATNGTVVGTVTATDAETNIKTTGGYAITAGNTDGAFAISDTGQITVENSPLTAGGTSYSLTVQATDVGNLTGTNTITVNVTSMPVTPPPSSPSSSSPVVTPAPVAPTSAPPSIPMTLTVSLLGTGTGTITSTPTSLNCSPTSSLCTYTVTTPTWVTLTATPGEGSQFGQWGGDTACQSDSKVFVMADTRCVTTFELQSYELAVGRIGDGQVTGPGLNCPPDCTETFLYGTDVQLEAKADREWFHTGWQGSCDQKGQLKISHDQICHAVFQEDPTVPNQLDGNGDGIPDAHQPNVISLPDKIVGNYVSFEVQPDTCAIRDVYTDLAENYGKPDRNKPLPQGLIYFDLACPQAQISVYYHAVNVIRRNFIFQKFGPKVPGDLNTVGWFTLPNVTFELAMVGSKPVVKATYTITDGGLGDGTGVDGRIVDPGGIMEK